MSSTEAKRVIEGAASDAAEIRQATKDVLNSLLELMDLREKTMGAPIDNQEAFARLVEERKKLRPLAAMHLQRGEERACSIFDHLYLINSLPECIPDDVERMRREYTFKSGRRADRIIFHSSGRLSVVEIKDACDQRAVVAGIGQALLYATLAEKEFTNTPIVPILAVLGDYDADVARACKRGGVEYVALGNVKFLSALSEMAHISIGG